jgi:hypothetical protein
VISELPAVVEALTGFKLEDLARRTPGFENGGAEAEAEAEAEELP